MEKEFVSYTQAVALKELGFDEHVFCTYNHSKDLIFEDDGPNRNSDIDYYNDDWTICAAPLKQQALRFLYEKSSLACRVAKNDSSDHKYYYSIAGPTYASYFDAVSFIDAESKLIDALIDIVKKGGMPPMSDLKDDQEEGLTKIK